MKRTITICTLVTFAAILFVYWLNDGNPWHRWSYALFVSVVPAIPVYVIARYNDDWPYWVVVCLYGACFSLVALVVELLRQIG